MQHDTLTPTPSPPPQAANAAWTLSPYVLAWTGLAVVAVAYISIAVARPDLLGATSVHHVAETNRALQSKTDEAEALAEKLARMEKDLQTSQSENSQRAAEKKSHLERIAALEAKAAKAEAEAKEKQAEQSPSNAATPAETSETVTAASKQAADEIADRLSGATILNNKDAADKTTTVIKQAAKTTANDAVTTAAKDVATKVVTSEAVAKPNSAKTTTIAKTTEQQPATEKSVAAKPAAEAKPAKVAAVKKPKPAPTPATKATTKIKTGSVGNAATNPISFGPAVVTRATKPIGVRIATGPSVDSLRLSWNALADRHGDSLRRLQPRYVTGIDATGLTYDLIAGPFDTANEASQVCARLHANGARCALGEFTGNAL